MSGEKCSAISVEENRRREERALNAAKSAATQLHRELKQLHSSVSSVQAAHPEFAFSGLTPMTHMPNTGSPRQEWERRGQSLKHEISEAKGELANLEQLANFAALSARRRSRPEKKKPEARVHARQEATNVEETIKRVISRLPHDVSKKHRDEIQSTVSLVLDEDNPAKQQNLVQRVRFQVQDATAHAENNRVRDKQLEAYRSKILGLPKEAALELEKRVNVFADPAIPFGKSSQRELESLILRQLVKDDESYAATTIASILADLGYSVGQDFETKFLNENRISLQSEQLENSSLEFEKIAGTDEFLARVVPDSSGCSDTARQRSEEIWCKDFDTVLTRLREASISSKVTHATRPGHFLKTKLAAPEGSKVAKRRVGATCAPQKQKFGERHIGKPTR